MPVFKGVIHCAVRCSIWMAMVLVPLQAAASPAGSAARDVARLYALPPEGSIYVRVANAQAAPLSVQVGEGRGEQVSAGGKVATDYYVQPGGQPFRVRVNGKPLQVATPAPASGFVTLLVGAGAGVRVVQDQQASGNTGLKAELALYNLVPGCNARLELSSGDVVLASVAEASRGTRAINPVQATLLAKCGARASAPLQLPALKAGDRYSLFVTGTANAPVLKGLAARTEPYRAR